MRFWLALVAPLLASPAFAEPVVVDGLRDGLEARLTVQDDGVASLRWRFREALPVPLSNLVVTYNGRTVPIGETSTYPQPGDATAALVVVDVTGGEARADAVSLERARAFRILEASRPHVRAALGVLSEGLQLIVPPDEEPFDPLLALVAIGTTDTESDLQDTLGAAIAAVNDVPDAGRRTIFILTDGHSDTPMDYAALTTAAKEVDVSVNVIAEPGREADLEALANFARTTGGFYVTGPEATQMLATPFRFVDSGASARVETGTARRYFWDKDNLLRVSFVYGNQSLTLQAPVSVPDANLGETMTYAWDYHGRTIGFALAGAGWAMVLVLMPFARLGRRTRRDKLNAAAVQQPLPAPVQQPANAAVIQMSDALKPARSAKPAALPAGSVRLRISGTTPTDKAVLDFSADRITIGRAKDNMVAVPNDSVSGHHAIIIRGEDGVFSLTNLSETNPTLLNGIVVQGGALRHGDELRLGDVKILLELGAKR
jgi:hypothetical protein